MSSKKIIFTSFGIAAGVFACLVFTVNPSEAAVKKTLPIKKFTSAADFKSYLKKSSLLGGSSAVGGVRSMALQKSDTGAAAPMAVGSTDVSRSSVTNVQVAGIDEPDMVKTGGGNIYLSSSRFYPIYATPMLMKPGGVANSFPYLSGTAQSIKAFPAENMAVLAKLPVSGDLLLDGNVLMVITNSTVYGYDITAPDSPKEIWKITLGEKESLVGARLYQSKLLIASEEGINFRSPCPLQPLVVGSAKVIVPCTAIYHPISPVPTDIVYTVASFDAKTGKLQKDTSFTGSSGASVVYMSENNFYLSYYNPGDQTRFNFNFLNSNKDLVPTDVLVRISKMLAYDISDSSKQNEFYYIINDWQRSLSDDDLLKLNNDIQNRMASYYPKHIRELDKTSIVKIGLGDFAVKGVGVIPGRLLNQYSLDEYNNNLRLAATEGQSFWYMGSAGATTKTANDVYVLGSDMAQVGSIKDLGLGEQIYSSRFIGDRGYLVTFKQTDPFFVLDLSSPSNPRVAGELKIPGYSGYLEPIGNHIILGVGKEDNKVKAALYDVSDAANPTEVSKYVLDEYWSEALNNPHAFLKDDKHSIFFIPGSQGGYIFSYDGNNLKLAKAVKDYSVERAVYINDTLYIVGMNKISAWNENTWEKINELTWNNQPVVTPYDSSTGEGSSGTIVVPPVLPAPTSPTK